MFIKIYLLRHQALAINQRILPLLFLFLAAVPLSSQSISQYVISNAGAYAEDSAFGNLHWSVGEIAVEQLENTSILSQGFHQTYFDLLSTAIWEYPEINLDLKIFPNPTSGWLNLETSYMEPLQLVITNVLGQTMTQQHNFSLNTQLDISHLPSGMYLLTILEKGRLIKSFKIQKQH